MILGSSTHLPPSASGLVVQVQAVDPHSTPEKNHTSRNCADRERVDSIWHLTRVMQIQEQSALNFMLLCHLEEISGKEILPFLQNISRDIA